jgi:hypothetical protein
MLEHFLRGLQKDEEEKEGLDVNVLLTATPLMMQQPGMQGCSKMPCLDLADCCLELAAKYMLAGRWQLANHTVFVAVGARTLPGIATSHC